MAEGTFFYVLLAGLFAVTVTTLGIIFIKKYEKWGEKNTIYFIAFAAGVLISISFLHIVPEAIEMSLDAPLFILIGFLTIYTINRLLHEVLCNIKKYKNYHKGIVPTLGIAFHSFLDGIIYSVTFNVSVLTGYLSVIGMIAHEFPEGIICFLLLKKAGFKKKKAAIYAFLAAGITTPLGALLSFPYIAMLSEDILGKALALSAGALIYVGASHLLPETEESDKRFALLTLLLGVATAFLIVSGHAH